MTTAIEFLPKSFAARFGASPSETLDEGQMVALMAHLSAAAQALQGIEVAAIAACLGSAAARLLSDGDPLREAALQQLPAEAGFSPQQARWVIDSMARDWTPAALQRLLEAEFADCRALDTFVPAPLEQAPDREVRGMPLGVADGVGVHICSGTVPGVGVTSMLRGLLTKAPVLLKPGAGDRVLPRLVARALGEAAAVDPVADTICEALAVLFWSGGAGGAVESQALAKAGYVVVYGADATVSAIQQRIDATVPLVAYPHRVGITLVSAQADPSATAAALARAVAAYEQRGCVSPQQAFVLADVETARVLAAATARALDQLAGELPAASPDPEIAAAVQQRRATIEMRHAIGESVELWASGQVQWTVVLDARPQFTASCLGRTLTITPVADLSALDEALQGVEGRLQAVGVAGFDRTTERAVAEIVARHGASRVGPLESMSFPAPGWIHDGQGGLTRLVRWSALAGP